MFLVDLYEKLAPYSTDDKSKAAGNIEMSYSSDIEVIFGFKPSMSRDLAVNVKTLSTPELGGGEGLSSGAPAGSMPLHGTASLPVSGFQPFIFSVEYYVDNLHLNYRFHVEWYMETKGSDTDLSDVMTHTTFNILNNHGEVSNVIDCGYTFPVGISELTYDTTLNMQRESVFTVKYAASNFEIRNPIVDLNC